MKSTFLLALIFLCSFAHAQRSGDREVSLSLGKTFSKESSPLNLPAEEALPSAAMGQGGIRFYLTEVVSVGVCGSIASYTLANYAMKKSGSSTSEKVDFSISAFTAGLESQIHLISRGHLRPYLTLQLLYCEHSLTATNYGALKGQGYLAGGGLGVRYQISDMIVLTAEGTGLFGSAAWKNPPSTSSLGTDLDPSSFRALGGILFLIH